MAVRGRMVGALARCSGLVRGAAPATGEAQCRCSSTGRDEGAGDSSFVRSRRDWWRQVKELRKQYVEDWKVAEPYIEAVKRGRSKKKAVDHHPLRDALLEESRARWEVEKQEREDRKLRVAERATLKVEHVKQKDAWRLEVEARLEQARQRRRNWLESTSSSWIREDELEGAIQKALSNPQTLESGK